MTGMLNDKCRQVTGFHTSENENNFRMRMFHTEMNGPGNEIIKLQPLLNQWTLKTMVKSWE